MTGEKNTFGWIIAIRLKMQPKKNICAYVAFYSFFTFECCMCVCLHGICEMETVHWHYKRAQMKLNSRETVKLALSLHCLSGIHLFIFVTTNLNTFYVCVCVFPVNSILYSCFCCCCMLIIICECISLLFCI